MKAHEFDKQFDTGDDITKYLNMSKARRSAMQKSKCRFSFMDDSSVRQGSKKTWRAPAVDY